MAKRCYPLSKVYGPLDLAPVLLLPTAHKGKIQCHGGVVAHHDGVRAPADRRVLRQSGMPRGRYTMRIRVTCSAVPLG